MRHEKNDAGISQTLTGVDRSIDDPRTTAAGNATRGRFLTAAALIAGAAPLGACSASGVSYSEASDEVWRPFTERITERSLLQRELVRYATLAPSSHNTQCWRFRLATNQLSILPDLARRCPAVDPDDHHLFVSLGCATENVVTAGLAQGLRSEVHFKPADGGAIEIAFQPARVNISPRFAAIPKRQCTRTAYAGKAAPAAHLRELEAAGQGNGVHLLLLTARTDMERVLQYVIEGNTTQMNDPAFMDELRDWIRFSDGEAISKRDGLFSRASGNPSVPRWFAAPLFNILFTAKGENEKYARGIRSSAGIAVFVSDTSDAAHWVETGRCYQRFALQATSLGIRTAMINQPVEVSSLRPQFARMLSIGARRPDLVVRFGYGPEMPRSLRRPVDAVILR